MAGNWREALDLPEDVVDELPRGYDVIGSVVIIRMPEHLAAYKDEVGEALIAKVPQAETAAVDWGVEGTVRARAIEVIGGKQTLLTEQKENGCRLLVDVGTCYYSPRLAGERARVADQVAEDERVLDMYAGVGP
ncbi:MAG: hypothetical protein R3185_01575, partial [Candidatus Thermoplasmatota archaeon]|nr:hypothetical protein [Candidatus Thermoplasmatota archaeon]